MLTASDDSLEDVGQLVEICEHAWKIKDFPELSAALFTLSVVAKERGADRLADLANAAILALGSSHSREIPE